MRVPPRQPTIHNKTEAEQEIKKPQQDRAQSMGIALDPRGYVREVEANLRQPLSSRARLAFEAGAGSELSGHMRALCTHPRRWALIPRLGVKWTSRRNSARG